ncbi:BrnT family toxin [Elstera sp.]|jgi:uncharacterized DUF497 family protein|uniref:BrnT family toxin n=1 Tax=Elstera sp. TaxID=1916664 RepID=UPI0037C09E6E
MKNIFESLVEYYPQGFEWDPVKNVKNLEKHKVSFEAARLMFSNLVIISKDSRRDYGEDRFIAIGCLGSVVLSVAFTLRGHETVRLISARKANKYERHFYHEAIQKRSDPSFDR